MPKTTTLPEPGNLEEARAALEAAQERTQELSAEMEGITLAIKALDWSNEEEAAAHLAELEQRKAALPHLIRHAQKTEAEVEIRFHEAEMEAAEAKREPLSKRIEELQEKYNETRGALDRARAEFQDLIIGEMSDIRRAKKAAHARLAALEREAASSPEERGPVVRSTWQRNPNPTIGVRV